MNTDGNRPLIINYSLLKTATAHSLFIINYSLLKPATAPTLNS